jgi:hypothetical protein
MPIPDPFPKPRSQPPISLPAGAKVCFEDPFREPSWEEVANFVVRTGLFGYNTHIKLALEAFLWGREHP